MVVINIRNSKRHDIINVLSMYYLHYIMFIYIGFFVIVIVLVLLIKSNQPYCICFDLFTTTTYQPQ